MISSSTTGMAMASWTTVTPRSLRRPRIARTPATRLASAAAQRVGGVGDRRVVEAGGPAVDERHDPHHEEGHDHHGRDRPDRDLDHLHAALAGAAARRPPPHAGLCRALSSEPHHVAASFLVVVRLTVTSRA